MSGVRVETIHRKVTEKELRIHFSKAEHGGGSVQIIYYPLFNNDAVIMFEENHTAEIVADIHLRESIKLHGHEIYVKVLPMLQVYPVLEAQLDDTVAEFLSATDEVRDEISYYRDLEYRHDKKTNKSSIKGNWYQLEWAWSYLDMIMRQQSQRHTEIVHTNRLKLTDQQSQRHTEIVHTNRLKLTDDAEAGTSRKRIQPQKDKREGPIISLPGERSSSVNNEEFKMRMGARVTIDTESKSMGADDLSSGKGARKKPSTLLKHDDRLQHENITYTDEEKSKSLPKHSRANDQEKQVIGNDKRHKQLKGNRTQVKGTRSDDSEDDNDDEDARCMEFKNKTGVLSDNPSDFRSFDFVVNDLKVTIYTGEIILAETEAIVNAANGSLGNYGGVARAITNAASPAMQRECDDFVKRFGEVQTAGVMHTCAGGRLNPKVKYILHSVGPVWAGNQSEGTCKRQLTTTFLNCLMYSNEHSVTSIALPVISSGIFGCPLELCVRAFLDAVLLFAHAHDDSEGRHLQDVHLINNDAENTAVTVVVIRQLIDQYGFDRLTQIAVTESVKQTSNEDSKPTRTRRHPSPIAGDRKMDKSEGDEISRSPSPQTRAPSVGGSPSMIAPPAGLSFPKRAPSIEVSPRSTATPGGVSPSMIAPPAGLSFPKKAPSVEMPAHTMGRPLPDVPRTETKRSNTTRRK